MKTALKVLYTIGHSTHPIEEFLQALQNAGIQLLVDVRTIPRSRHNPQYDQTALADSLRKVHIHYAHMAGLGGLRKPKPPKESINTGWRNASFRGYADYMQTSLFHENLEKLMALAEDHKTVIMCAEAVPWRCHRSMIADALLAHGWKVIDIMDQSHQKAHAMNPMAQTSHGRVFYPPEK